MEHTLEHKLTHILCPFLGNLIGYNLAILIADWLHPSFGTEKSGNTKPLPAPTFLSVSVLYHPLYRFASP